LPSRVFDESANWRQLSIADFHLEERNELSRAALFGLLVAPSQPSNFGPFDLRARRPAEIEFDNRPLGF